MLAFVRYMNRLGLAQDKKNKNKDYKYGNYLKLKIKEYTITKSESKFKKMSPISYRTHDYKKLTMIFSKSGFSLKKSSFF